MVVRSPSVLLLTLLRGTSFVHIRMNMGNTLFHLGDPVRAMELYQEALAIYEIALN